MSVAAEEAPVTVGSRYKEHRATALEYINAHVGLLVVWFETLVAHPSQSAGSCAAPHPAQNGTSVTASSPLVASRDCARERLKDAPNIRPPVAVYFVHYPLAFEPGSVRAVKPSDLRRYAVDYGFGRRAQARS